MTKQLICILIFIICFIPALMLESCHSYIATTDEYLPYHKDQVLQAAKQVADKVSMERTDGPLNAFIYSKSIFSNSSVTVMNADLYLRKKGHPFMGKNNTEVIGALRLNGEVSETECLSVFGTIGADPLANSKMMIALTQQQIELNLKSRAPFVNPHKSAGAYIALDLVSPQLGLDYLQRDNPLLTPAMLHSLQIGYGTPDAVMVGCVAASFFVKNPNTKSGLLGAGITLGGFIRLFTMLNLIDMADYNDLARTDYNLSEVRQKY
ncbi:MAG TPA: hypothetical protein VMF88_13735 [Bacteroidota bacterium]|nr:hypothetical protein [Bacteroidota bacterium]